jgi:hypothetical protein
MLHHPLDGLQALLGEPRGAKGDRRTLASRMTASRASWPSMSADDDSSKK